MSARAHRVATVSRAVPGPPMGSGTAAVAVRIAVMVIAAAAVGWEIARPDRSRGPGAVAAPQTYVDAGQGFAIRLPAGMEMDRTLGDVATVIADRRTRVLVFHDADLGDATWANYVSYKRRPIDEKIDPVTVLRDRTTTTDRFPVHELWWRRPPLRRVPGDRNYYATFDFVAGERDVWSVHVKTSDPGWVPRNAGEIVRSFVAFAPSGDAAPEPRRATGRAVPMSPAARETYARLFETDRQTWGIYEPGWHRGADGLRELEARLHHRFAVVLDYILIDEKRTFENLDRARREGQVVELTLQLAPPSNEPSSAFVYELVDGMHDADLRRIARDVARFGDGVLFRLNNEMNGDWVVWSGYFTSQDADIFKALWRRVYQIFAEEGATNAIWVWNPHDRSFPPFKYNHMLMYDPGPEYYDVVGMTGYNNGTYYPREVWRSFDEIYAPLYDEYVRLFPGRRFIITEFAASSIGGDKAAWIRDAMQRLRAYPDIKVAVWWNGTDMDGDTPARPYRLKGDDVLDAFADGLAGYR